MYIYSIYNIPVLLWIKKLNSLMYRMLFYFNICETYKLSKNSPVFLAYPVYVNTRSLVVAENRTKLNVITYHIKKSHSVV